MASSLPPPVLRRWSRCAQPGGSPRGVVPGEAGPEGSVETDGTELAGLLTTIRATCAFWKRYTCTIGCAVRWLCVRVPTVTLQNTGGRDVLVIHPLNIGDAPKTHTSKALSANVFAGRDYAPPPVGRHTGGRPTTNGTLRSN